MTAMDALGDALQSAGLSPVALRAADGGRAVVVPELGAKLLGAGVDEENLLWVPAGLAAGQWCVGGQRTWLAPELGPRGFFGRDEASWAVHPALDPGNYRPTPPRRRDSSEAADAGHRRLAAEARCAFLSEMSLLRADGSVVQVAVKREIAVLGGRNAGSVGGLRIRVRHALVNRDRRTLERETGLWGIVQVPSEADGTILMPVTSDREPRLYFGELPPDWVRRSAPASSLTGDRRSPRAGALLYLRARAGQRYKVGLNASDTPGVLAFVRPSRVGPLWSLVVQRSLAPSAETYVDGPLSAADGPGDAIQCYNHSDPGLPFSELECHAPARRLAPMARQSASLYYLFAKGPRERILEAAGREIGRTVDPGLVFG